MVSKLFPINIQENNNCNQFMKATVVLCYNKLSGVNNTTDHWVEKAGQEVFGCSTYIASPSLLPFNVKATGYVECARYVLCIHNVKPAFCCSQLWSNSLCNVVDNKKTKRHCRNTTIFIWLMWKGCYHFQETTWMQSDVTPDKSQCKSVGLEGEKK